MSALWGIFLKWCVMILWWCVIGVIVPPILYLGSYPIMCVLLLTFSLSCSPPGTFSLSLPTVAQEGLCTRLRVQAIPTAYCVGTEIHTFKQFIWITRKHTQNTFIIPYHVSKSLALSQVQCTSVWHYLYSEENLTGIHLKWCVIVCVCGMWSVFH